MEDGRDGIVLSVMPGARDIAGLEAGRVGLLKLEKVFAVDSAVGVKELVGDVGQNGSAARETRPLADQDQGACEVVVYVNSGLELGGLTEEFGGEVLSITLRRRLGGPGGAQAEIRPNWDAKAGSRQRLPLEKR